jgi:hypothetical protein
MTATPARIGFITQATRSVVASDTAVKTKYGELARDTKDEPVETYFDSVVDAQLVATERLTLLKADRRRFKQTVRGVLDLAGSFSFAQVLPTVTVIDDERQANLPALVVDIAIDPLNERTDVICWG